MSPPIRIASVSMGLHIGGDENRLLNYCLTYDRKRFEQVVITMMSRTDENDRTIGPIRWRYEQAGVEVIDLGETLFRHKRPLPRPLDLVRRGAICSRMIHKLAHILRKRRIDIVDARMIFGAVVAVPAGRLAGVRGITVTDYMVPNWQSAALSWFGRSLLALTDCIICDSQVKLDEIRSSMRFPPPGVLIPNGISPPAGEKSRVAMADHLGIPSDATIVGQVARVLPFKGQDLLLHAAAEILKHAPDTWFLICGYSQLDHAYRTHLDACIAKLNIGHRVRFLAYPGPIGDVWPLIDIHTHPTRLDSSPIAILEAMSLGRPSVVTSVGGIPELVINEQTGLVVPPDAPTLLAAALLRLIRDPALARRLALRAHARYLERHRPETMARAHERLFESIYHRSRWRSAVAQPPVKTF